MTPQPMTAWPAVVTGYTDEFGTIDEEVYGAAGEIWPWAERRALALLHDGSEGERLLLKAAAAVSQVLSRQPGVVASPGPYLATTYRRLLAGAARTADRHRALERESVRGPATLETSDAVDQRILAEEVSRLMDPWTRRVFTLLSSGCSFDEIGCALGERPRAVRTRFRHRLRRLARRGLVSGLPPVRRSASHRAGSRVPVASPAPDRTSGSSANDRAR